MLQGLPVLTGDRIHQELGRGGILALLFGRDSQAACHVLATALERIAAEYEGKVTVAAVDTARDPAAASAWLVGSQPTVLLFVDGAAVDRVEGVISYAELTQRLDLVVSVVQQTRRRD